jgi:23S rRNA (guanosine2251-2'-O)-methyltransferase
MNMKLRQDDEAGDYVYGRWPVQEALAHEPVTKLFLVQGQRGPQIAELLALAKAKRVPFHFVERRRLDQMVDGNHQGLVAQVAPMHYAEAADVLAAARAANGTGARVLFLDGVTDPQNVGSILRSAVFFNVTGVILPKWRAAGLTSSVVRASAGAARLLPIARVSNLASALEDAKNQGFWLVGADVRGEDVGRAQVPRPFALVMGAEGEGLHELTRKKCDLLVRIERRFKGAGVDSLNVGAAAAILLHHLS